MRGGDRGWTGRLILGAPASLSTVDVFGDRERREAATKDTMRPYSNPYSTIADLNEGEASALTLLGHEWAALAHGMRAVEALLATRGPKPAEPPDDAPDAEVEAWTKAVVAWESAGDEILHNARVLPGVIADQRRNVERALRGFLYWRPEFEEVEDWDAALLEVLEVVLGTLLGHDREWVQHSWNYR